MPSSEAQNLAADLDLMGSSLQGFSSSVLPVGAALLAFVLMAWLLKRFLYV